MAGSKKDDDAAPLFPFTCSMLRRSLEFLLSLADLDGLVKIIVIFPCFPDQTSIATAEKILRSVMIFAMLANFPNVRRHLIAIASVWY